PPASAASNFALTARLPCSFQLPTTRRRGPRCDASWRFVAALSKPRARPYGKTLKLYRVTAGTETAAYAAASRDRGRDFAALRGDWSHGLRRGEPGLQARRGVGLRVRRRPSGAAA